MASIPKRENDTALGGVFCFVCARAVGVVTASVLRYVVVGPAKISYGYTHSASRGSDYFFWFLPMWLSAKRGPFS